MKILRDIAPNGMPIIVDAIKKDSNAKTPDKIIVYPILDSGVELVVGEPLPLDMDGLKPYMNQ